MAAEPSDRGGPGASALEGAMLNLLSNIATNTTGTGVNCRVLF